MIKLRLTGLPAELDQMVQWLVEQPEIKVLSTSAKYANRDSEYYRQYVEFETATDKPPRIKKVPL